MKVALLPTTWIGITYTRLYYGTQKKKKLSSKKISFIQHTSRTLFLENVTVEASENHKRTVSFTYRNKNDANF